MLATAPWSVLSPAVHRSLIALMIACALVASACSSETAVETTTTAPPETTTSSSTTTTTSSTTTTTEAPRIRTLEGDLPEFLLAEAETFYSWLVDRSNPEPDDLPEGLVRHVADTTLDPGPVEVTGQVRELENGDRVAVITGADGTLVLTRTGPRWRIRAALLTDHKPWISGPRQRTLLVLGSDAREGQDQERLRADSIHILTLLPAQGRGAFVGLPRDSWVGGRKLTDQMPGGGPDRMVDLVGDLSGLEFDGYVLVGFAGFLGLMEELGGLTIDLPRPMRSGNNWDNYPEGPQELTPTLALRLARIRKGLPAGDFDRSFNQGLVTLAAMNMIQEMGIEQLPRWVAAFDEHGFTDLGTIELATLFTSTYLASPKKLTNVVVPASVGSVAAASVVFLGDGAERMFRDLEDGILDNED